MARELICNVYNYQWTTVGSGGSGSIPTPAQVDTWLARIKDCGFTAIAINERLSAFTGTSWNFWSTNALVGSSETILHRLEASGLKILLRIWADLPDATIRAAISEAYGPECIGPDFDGYALNAYAPKSAQALAAMASALMDQGVYDAIDWIVVGWDGTGEVDDVRGFVGQPTLTRPARPAAEGISRTAVATGRAVAGPRTVRINDATEAMGIMFRAVSAELGNSKPIGCMRGSAWQNQPKRRTLPYFPDETFAQSNDANQCPNAWVIGSAPTWSGPFYPSPYEHPQQEAVCFSCDLIRGTGTQHGVLEADVLGFSEMDPGLGDFDDISEEIVRRATWCYERGVSFMFTHWVYSSSAPANITGLNVWQDTISDSIVPLLDEEDLPLLSPIQTAPFLVDGTNLNNCNYIADAVGYWRTAGGALDSSVPLAFAYALA